MKSNTPAPVLRCQISGQSRKTSHNYIASKAKRLGVSSEWLLENYVSKYVCSQLRAGKSLDFLNANRLDPDNYPPCLITDELLKELVQKNSKSRVTNFWFEGGVYKTAKPTPKKKEEKVQSLDEVVAKTEVVEEKEEPVPVPVVAPPTFDEALAELNELS